MTDSTAPDFLAIGVLTLDVTPEPGNPHGRVRPGGAAAFAALCAQALGLNVAVVASAAPNYPIETVLPGIDVHLVESNFTTFFQNVYGPSGTRSQVLGARASSITLADVPDHWLTTPTVFLGPLVGEVPVGARDWFTDAAVGATVQGWLRRWDHYGRVTEVAGPPTEMADPTMSSYRLLVGSKSEFGGSDEQEIKNWTDHADVLGVTDGKHGVHVYSTGSTTDVPGFPAVELDPTGAGDIWAAACLIRLVETNDPVVAARFANAAASISVERDGLSGPASREEIEMRMAGGSG
ncbi:MAG: hypothetical protein HOC77_09585 [Chloroflexi bacterium]|nr:hypothetical protein [Chloroflexota bacterium]MBT4515325.1 hypothetical protein [Chloroflexota bacterium]MBT5318927.1 hypothetical protein [Chloroflexota bacterium]MBT6683164.1 hypothetical protein [Chloroflexota bacterium]